MSALAAATSILVGASAASAAETLKFPGIVACKPPAVLNKETHTCAVNKRPGSVTNSAAGVTGITVSKTAEAEHKTIKEMEEEARALEAELKELEHGGD